MSNRAVMRNEIRSIAVMWPDVDRLVGGITATATSLTITDRTRAPAGSQLEILATDGSSEVMIVRSVSGNTLTVRRGAKGTPARSHADASTVHIHGPYDVTDHELNTWIIDAVEWLYPVTFVDVWDSNTYTVDGKLEYVIPSSIDMLDELFLQDAYYSERWNMVRTWRVHGAKVLLPLPLPGGRLLRFHGIGRFASPTTDQVTFDTGRDLLGAVRLYVLSHVVKTQEVLRTRFTGQSALLEARAGNVPEMIGSSRELMRQAIEIRAQHAVPRRASLRRIMRSG